MFRCGDQVLYSSHGLCRVIDLQLRKIDRKTIEYYVLEPMDQPGARFYVPTQNQAAVSKLQPIITKSQLEELLRTVSQADDDWIEDENQRKQRYRELICSGDRASLMGMIRALHRHKAKQESAGKKFHQCDENFLRDAQKLLSVEFSTVLDISLEQVGQYITKYLD